MDKLKILIFNWRCWQNPGVGGAEIFTYEVARRWVEDGNEITLFTSKFLDCKKEEILDGIRIVRSGGKYSVYRKAREYYKKQFLRENYDVVIDEINTRPFLTPKFVNNGEKIVALIHQLAREYWFHETSFPANIIGYYFLEKWWLKNYFDTPTITVSESTRKDLKTLGFKNIYVVPEGLSVKPIDKLPKKALKPTIIYVGRLKRAKRANHLIRAFEIVVEKITDAELWIVGDGYLLEELKNKHNTNVNFFGRVTEKEKNELLSEAWVLVNPSVREGFGLNIIEANAFGTPAIGYDVPGLRDSIKHGETGVLVKSGDIVALAETIINLLMNGELRRELSNNALNYSKEFSWDNTAQEFLNIIKANM